jgi:hypothetical protein
VRRYFEEEAAAARSKKKELADKVRYCNLNREGRVESAWFLHSKLATQFWWGGQMGMA